MQKSSDSCRNKRKHRTSENTTLFAGYVPGIQPDHSPACEQLLGNQGWNVIQVHMYPSLTKLVFVGFQIAPQKQSRQK